MSRIVKESLVAVLLLGSSVLAQQDPGDLGLQDSVYIEVTQFYTGGECQVAVDVYFLNDAQTLEAGCAFIRWDHPGLMYDSMSATPLADSAFNDVIGFSRNSARANRYQAFTPVCFSKPGLSGAPLPRNIGSIHFHLEEWQPGDLIHFDTAMTELVRTEFAPSTGGTYAPAWPGAVDVELKECNPTGIDQPGTGGALPVEYALAQNYPNPFNPSTSIDYSLPAASVVELVVFNELGRRVATLADGLRSAGPHTACWDGRDDAGEPVASGVYLYRLSAGEFVQSRKMLLLK